MKTNILRHKSKFFLQKFLGYSFVFLFLSSCNLHRLNVQSQYISRNNLASFYTQTPDPKLIHPIIGQRLLIEWCLSNHEIKNKDLELYAIIRLKNNREIEKNVHIPSSRGKIRRGYEIFELINEDYCESGGIQTYKVELYCEGEIIDRWIHPLWAKLILLTEDNS